MSASIGWDVAAGCQPSSALMCSVSPGHNRSQDVRQTCGGEGGATSKCKAANIISYPIYYHEKLIKV